MVSHIHSILEHEQFTRKKRDQESGFIKLDWSATINLGEGQKVESLSVKKIFTGP